MRLALVLALVTASSCTCGSRTLMTYGSSSDVEDLLRAHGVSVPSLTCRNVRLRGSIIRGLSCPLRVTPGDLATLTASMPMTHGAAWHSAPSYSDSCESMPGLISTDPGVEVFIGKNAKVTNGIGRVELHVVPATGNACVEIEYPFG